MKKNIIATAALLLISIVMMAVPAKQGKREITQPDGSIITVYVHGDEFFHWATDEAGNIVTTDENGFVVKSSLSKTTLSAMMKEATERRAAANNMYRAAANRSANTGSPLIPVLLVGFQQKDFSHQLADFDAMLNTQGYSANSAKGSVLDYFNDNSFGQFTPRFEVLGPVQLDNTLAYYGQNKTNGDDTRPYAALYDAIKKLDGSVDFSRYDNDGDGTVDFIMFYYAGNDEAQTYPSGTNNIWSHASSLEYFYTDAGRTFDGVKIGEYFCTAELYGTSETAQCHIGTTCHEFAHTLGLPDFYDADYSTNGSAANMYDFDLMAGGPYNGDMTSPPYMNAEEVMEVGWLSAIPELSATGQVTLPSVNYPGAESYSAYMTRTAVNGEYFVFETRGGQHWDSPLPKGMMVYHVDRSSGYVSRWGANTVNNYSSHPCCYVVPAADPTGTTVYNGSMSSFFFPGSGNVTTYTPTAWSGSDIGYQFNNIRYSNGITTFNVSNSNELGITGHVWDSDGLPISGVTVVISGPQVESAPARTGKSSGSSLLNKIYRLFSPSRKAVKAKAASSAATVTTDSEGFYKVLLQDAGQYEVVASIEGYVSQTANVSVSARLETQDFYLLKVGETGPSEIIPFPLEADAYAVGSGEYSMIGQNLFPVSEMAKYAGKQIKEISFYLCGEEDTTFEEVYAIVDYGDTRKATVKAKNEDVAIEGWTTVDLRDQELIIPSNKDIYAGCAFKNWTYDYPFVANFLVNDDNTIPEWADGWPYEGYVAEFNLTATGERYDWDVVFWIYLTIGDYEGPDTGYNYIEDPKAGSYSAGDVFALTLVETEGSRKPGTEIAWYLDDEPVSGASVTLTSGEHVIEARFITTEGKTKIVELEISVE